MVIHKPPPILIPPESERAEVSRSLPGNPETEITRPHTPDRDTPPDPSTKTKRKKFLLQIYAKIAAMDLQEDPAGRGGYLHPSKPVYKFLKRKNEPLIMGIAALASGEVEDGLPRSCVERSSLSQTWLQYSQTQLAIGRPSTAKNPVALEPTLLNLNMDLTESITKPTHLPILSKQGLRRTNQIQKQKGLLILGYEPNRKILRSGPGNSQRIA